MPPAPQAPAVFDFVWDGASGGERFQMKRRVGYVQRQATPQVDRQFIVPRDLRQWRTDFASVPPVFAWLVPKAGDHLPAAVLHDALVEGTASYLGSAVTRDEADAVFRDAMADLGTGVVRRWLVWTAVTLATIVGRKVGPPRAFGRWYYFAVAVATLLAILYCGAQATIDVLDIGGGSWWARELPWMTGGRFWDDVWRGAAGAVVIPSLLSVFWGRFWAAGVIAGIALAFLLHVTTLIAGLTVVYLAVERFGTINHGRALLVLMGVLGLVAVGVFVLALGLP